MSQGIWSLQVRSQAISAWAGPQGPGYVFDRAGRLFQAYQDGRVYRRGLDNRVLATWRSGSGLPDGGGSWGEYTSRQRRWLTESESAALVAAAYALGHAGAAADPEPELRVLGEWSHQRLAEDAARYAAIYQPVSILPPDQYLALVLQASEGCSFNTCTFCDLYRGRPFRLKSPHEFAAHLSAVRVFFGPGLSLRRSVFLADANALVAPMPLLRSWLQAVAASGILPGAGIHSFLDAFSARRKPVSEWAELAQLGLRRVTIGLESGDDGLLAFLRKPGRTEDVVAAVCRLKSAGIAVSLVVMIGIGGHRYAETHVSGSLAVLNALPLDGGDIIYLSPFVEAADGDYARLASQEGITPLTAAEAASQEQALRAGLRWQGGPGAPRIARYDLRGYLY